MDHIFISQLFRNPVYFFITAFVVVFSVCLHEYFHALFALRLGDDTAARNGHLTLNPLRQMGVWALVIFLLLGFTWGAVPVNPEKLRERHKWGPSVVALAGPLANLILAVIAWVAYGILSAGNVHVNIYVEGVIVIFGTLNIALLLFNLIPIPGLDGWNAIMSWFPDRKFLSSETVKGVVLFVVLIAFFFVSYIFQFARFVMDCAPNFFSSTSISKSVLEGDLEHLAIPLHKIVWTAAPRVVQSGVCDEKISTELYDIVNSPLDVREVSSSSVSPEVKRFSTVKIKNTGFIFLVDKNDNPLAYLLKWHDDRWFLYDCSGFGNAVKRLDALRCSEPTPGNIVSSDGQKALAGRAEKIIRLLFNATDGFGYGADDVMQYLTPPAQAMVSISFPPKGMVRSLKCVKMTFSDGGNNALLTFRFGIADSKGNVTLTDKDFSFELYPDRGWLLAVANFTSQE